MKFYELREKATNDILIKATNKKDKFLIKDITEMSTFDNYDIHSVGCYHNSILVTLKIDSDELLNMVYDEEIEEV